MKFFILVVLAGLVCCKPHQPLAADVQDRNTAIVKNLFEQFNRHDWKKMADLYADPATFRDPSFGTAAISQTRQQTIAKYSGYLQQFPDIHDAVEQIYPSGDQYVIAAFVSTGTPAGGQKWILPICTVFTIKNGLIVKDDTYYDVK